MTNITSGLPASYSSNTNATGFWIDHGNKEFEEKLKKITLAYSQLKKTLGKK